MSSPHATDSIPANAAESPSPDKIVESLGAAEESSTTGPQKKIEFKGQSRVLKKCHWCTKKQDPNEEPFKACGQCKEVIYCVPRFILLGFSTYLAYLAVAGVSTSKLAAPQGWFARHRYGYSTSCKLNRDQKAAFDQAGASEDVKTFKKWHSLHIETFKHALVCALDLSINPTNIDSGYMFIEVKRKPNHADLQMKRKFELVEGLIFTPEEVHEMLGAQGRTILDNTKRQGEYMKAKGGIGMAPIIMKYGGVVDIVNFILPRPEGAKLMQKQNNWGKDWVMHLAGALQHA